MKECVEVNKKVNSALYNYIRSTLRDIEIVESDMGSHNITQACQQMDRNLLDLEKSKLLLYANICGGAVASAPYLVTINIPPHRVAVTKLRTSNHSVMIEKKKVECHTS